MLSLSLLPHSHWPGLRKIELLASVNTEQLETERTRTQGAGSSLSGWKGWLECWWTYLPCGCESSGQLWPALPGRAREPQSSGARCLESLV